HSRAGAHRTIVAGVEAGKLYSSVVFMRHLSLWENFVARIVCAGLSDHRAHNFLGKLLAVKLAYRPHASGRLAEFIGLAVLGHDIAHHRAHSVFDLLHGRPPRKPETKKPRRLTQRGR